ncbi:MAG: DNA/RNA non-specific endonuclease [Ferruginibacter sp.]
MKKLVFILIVSLPSFFVSGQSINEKIKTAAARLSQLEMQKQVVASLLEDLKLEKIQVSLQEIGLPTIQPGEQLVSHLAYSLSYAEKFEQPRWVAHIVLPDIVNGVVLRTNDFRVDSSVRSGSAVEADYFLKKINADSSITYDGFGYDRGHLAPSADFRWSRKALSESYFYSNMSPQLADFNRGGWGDLEDAIRGYIFAHPGAQLYIVTGPVLQDDLPRMERSIHKVAIPAFFWKVALDLENRKGIAFLMPHAKLDKPLYSYATTIRNVEQLTGLNFFNKLLPALQDSVENQMKPTDWLPEKNMTDAEPLSQEQLPRNFFNTIVAANYINKADEINVCGKVVGARASRAGNILINLDKQFPNQVFTVFIKKEDIVNFNYDLVESLKGKVICVKGKVANSGGTPTMYISTQASLTIQDK